MLETSLLIYECVISYADCQDATRDGSKIMIKGHSPFFSQLYISLFSTILLLSSHTAEASSTIYGFNNIKNIKKNASTPYYIQMGAFKNMQLAQHLLHQKNDAYPVKIKNHGAFHIVMMGPIASYDELQQLKQYPIQHQTMVKKTHASHHQQHQVSSTSSFSKNPMNLLLQKNKPADKPLLPAGYHTTTRHSFKQHHITAPVQTTRYHEVERTDTPATPYRDRPFVLNFSVGIGTPSYASSLTVSNGSDFPAPYNLDAFSTKKNTQALLSVGIGKRYKPDLPSLKSLILGVRYQYLVPENIGKNLAQYSSPEFLNYNYHWSMISQILTAEAKANFIREARLSPYANVGLGVTFNQAKGYMETALPSVTERYSPAFESKSAPQFLWHAGVGLDYDISRDWIASLGYDFEALGPFNSGRGVGTWQADSLQLGNVYTNMAMLGISYILR